MKANIVISFESLKMVICFNRADRKITDGGGVIAEVALYEKESLGYTVSSANAAGDTMYLLQGSEERLLANEDNFAQLPSFEDSLTLPEGTRVPKYLCHFGDLEKGY